MGANWSGAVTVEQSRSLIRSGRYHYGRDAIDTGILLAFIGAALAWAEWRGLLAVLLVAVTLIIKLCCEERWMLAYVGDVYSEYRKASWALLRGLC